MRRVSHIILIFLSLTVANIFHGYPSKAQETRLITDVQKDTARKAIETLDSHDHLDIGYIREAMLKTIASENDLEKKGWHYFTMLNLLLDNDDKGLKFDLADKLKGIGEETGNPEFELLARISVAYQQSLEGKVADSYQEITDLKNLADDSNTPISSHLADNLLAVLAPDLGYYTEGLARMTERVEQKAQNSIEHLMVMNSYASLSYIYQSINDIEKTLEYVSKGIMYADEYDALYDREVTLYTLARTLLRAQEYRLSEDAFLAMQKITYRNNNPSNQYYVFYGLAFNAREQGLYYQAIENAKRATEEFPENLYFNLNLFFLLAESYAKLGDAEKAQEFLNKTFSKEYDGYERENTGYVENDRNFARANILYAQGQYQDAFDQLNKVRSKDRQFATQNLQNSIRGLNASLDNIRARQEAERELKSSENAFLGLAITGSIVIILISSFAIINQRKYAKSLEISSREAEDANRAKSEFLASMSHELRTPLNAILGFSEMFKKEIYGPLGSEKYSEYSDHIYESGSHLLSIINDILDLSKVEAGKLSLAEEEVFIADIVEDAVNLITDKVDEKNIHLSLEQDNQIEYLYCDPRITKQILLNLLSNAVKFTPQNGLIIVSSTLSLQNNICISVKDNGIGMSDADLERALQPFGQAGNAFTRQNQGTGLGLPLVEQLIEQHGGSMQIKSEPGKGTEVTLCFPAERTIIEGDTSIAHNTI
ncbi:ATP-binding protein [Kordiimonas sp. SCSIO 12610]|uniref:tetratricopeptide repeat-containing sensor histidine kinase n=1 Tax=Kordiimonas sp. SCSIO 12610 TaxID=2829597 RepID=UPI0021087A7F|nr:ATP-binding protein [Kordiimonas sp. SCSIO 12610]UTW54874.1 hypothetical protein KFF44_13835 [Kordiimonas sp. SCSIO 12610]